MPQLRGYQDSKMVTPARAALRESRSVVVVGATGSGKTSCIAYMVKGAKARGNRILIIVHKQEILGQILETLHRWGVQAGQIAAGKSMTRELVQVAMIGTLYNRLDILPYNYDMVVLDEAHHLKEGNMWGRAFNHPRLKDAYRIGFSATPQGRTDGTGLGHFFESIVQGVSTMELIKEGWLVFPRVYRPEKEVTDNFRVTRGDYDKNQQEEVFGRRQIVGDAIAHYKQYLDGLPAVVSCVSLKHAHDMQKAYHKYAQSTGKSWTGVMIQGGKKHEGTRIAALNGLADGSVQLVFFVDVLGEGVDVPVCTGIQMLRKTTSLVLYLQFIGRVLRPVWPDGFNQYTSNAEQRLQVIAKGAKPYAVVLDHAGNYYTHGHPVAARQWGLDDTVTGKKVAAAAPTITSCPKCNGVWPGNVSKCPGCGAIITEVRDNSRRNPQVIKGLLREVADLEDSELNNLAGFAATLDGMEPEQARKQMLSALRRMNKKQMDAVAHAIGYKKNWTATMYRRLNIKPPTQNGRKRR